MARIRSVHPSLFTDEAWVSCSAFSRVLYIGLLTEADDQGLFEWKPLQIKMRLLPGDNADVAALLDELCEANLIAPLDSAGKRLGAVRRFCKFQRPKKPTSHFHLPAEWRSYVGLSPDASEPQGDEDPPSGEPEQPDAPQVRNQFPTSTELGEQMEDGGGRKEEIPPKAPQGASIEKSPPVRKADVEAVWADAPRKSRERSSRADVEKALCAAARRGFGPTEVRRGLATYYVSHAATKDDGEFVKGVHRMIENDRWRGFAETEAASEAAVEPEDPWRRRLREFTANGYWNRLEWGPPPGKTASITPPEVLREFGIEPTTPRAVGSAA